MKACRFPRFAVALAVALITASLAATVTASANALARAPARAADPHGFTSFVPGATRQWCDSLPYPYCSDPAPGVPISGAPLPGGRPMAPHPIFGE